MDLTLPSWVLSRFLPLRERRVRRLSKYLFAKHFFIWEPFRFYQCPSFCLQCTCFSRGKYCVLKRSEKHKALALFLTRCVWPKLSPLTFLSPYFLYCKTEIIILVIPGILGAQIKKYGKALETEGILFFSVRERKRDLAFTEHPPNTKYNTKLLLY